MYAIYVMPAVKQRGAQCGAGVLSNDFYRLMSHGLSAPPMHNVWELHQLLAWKSIEGIFSCFLFQVSSWK